MELTEKEILDLGWNIDLTIKDEDFKKYYLNNYILGYNFKNQKLGMIIADLSKDINYLKTMNDPSIRNLNVKTKEELKVLMKQFGINE